MSKNPYRSYNNCLCNCLGKCRNMTYSIPYYKNLYNLSNLFCMTPSILPHNLLYNLCNTCPYNHFYNHLDIPNHILPYIHFCMRINMSYCILSISDWTECYKHYYWMRDYMTHSLFG